MIPMATFGATSADTVSPARVRRASGWRNGSITVPFTASSYSGPAITDWRRRVRYIGGIGWASLAPIRHAELIRSAVLTRGCFGFVFRLVLDLPRLNLLVNDLGIVTDETFGPTGRGVTSSGKSPRSGSAAAAVSKSASVMPGG